MRTCYLSNAPELKSKWVFLMIAYCRLFVHLLTFYIFIFSSRTSRAISTKLDTKLFFWWRGFKFFQTNDHALLNGETVAKREKIYSEIYKSSSLESLGLFQPYFNQIWLKTSLGDENSYFFREKAMLFYNERW